MISLFIMVFGSLVVFVLGCLVGAWLDDGGSFMSTGSAAITLVFLMICFMCFFLPDTIIEESEKTITTTIETIYCKEDTSPQQREYIKSQAKGKRENTYWYYNKENETIVPKEIQEKAEFKIKFTNEAPYTEIIKIEADSNFVNKWSIPHALGIRSCEKLYYIFYVPEGSVSDEMYLEHSSNFDEATIVIEAQKY